VCPPSLKPLESLLRDLIVPNPPQEQQGASISWR
jgi:hypothetical protein